MKYKCHKCGIELPSGFDDSKSAFKLICADCLMEGAREYARKKNPPLSPL